MMPTFKVWMQRPKEPKLDGTTNTGLFMTPYNVKMWKANERNPNGFLYARLYANDSQCIKLKADSNYMNAMSAVEVENKNYTINQLILGKTNYYQWIVLIKNQNCQ
jgi:hypothetical protein